MKRWTGSELESLRLSYEDATMTVEEVATRFGTSRGLINKMARIHGWPLRRPPGRMDADLKRIKNIRTVLAWRIDRMTRRLEKVDQKIREMVDGS